MALIWDYAPLMAQGALVTISVALLSLFLATALGVLGALAKQAGAIWAQGIAVGYTTLIRGVPDLVMILLIYFGGQRSINMLMKSMGFGYTELSAFWAGVISIGFIYGAYLTETFRGAAQSVPRGQTEAARALGLSQFAILWTVLLPQIARHALPGYANTWQVLVKSTAVVSVIGLEDIVNLADKAGKSTREPFLFFSIVILVYLAITAISSQFFEAAQRRANRGHAT